MAGAYTYLPLGLATAQGAKQIVHEEMDLARAVKLAVPLDVPAPPWEQTGRVAASQIRQYGTFFFFFFFMYTLLVRLHML